MDQSYSYYAIREFADRLVTELLPLSSLGETNVVNVRIFNHIKYNLFMGLVHAHIEALERLFSPGIGKDITQAKHKHHRRLILAHGGQ